MERTPDRMCQLYIGPEADPPQLLGVSACSRYGMQREAPDALAGMDRLAEHR